MRLKNKLLILACVPLFFLLFFSIRITLEKTQQAQEMTALEELARVSATVGALIHELQKERGMSAGFIGSKGSNFSSELTAQRLEVDKSQSIFAKQLSSFNASDFGEKLKSNLNEAEKQLGELSSKRQAVSAFGLSGPETIAYYSNTIASLLTVIAETSSVASDPKISRIATSYGALLQGKEFSGIERATLANVFGSDKFSPEMLIRFLSISSFQEIWLELFHRYASPEQAAFFKDKMTGSAVDEVSKIKKSATENMLSPSLGIDAKVWFAKSTERINLLKDVEDRLGTDLLGMAKERRAEARLMMMIYLGLTLLAIALTLFITFKLIREILKQIGGEPDYAAQIARKIAQGDLSGTVALQSDDQSSLLAAMKAMQTSLRDMVDKVIDATTQLVNSAQQLAVSSKQVMAATDRQSDAAASVAATVEEMTVSIGHISDNAADVHNSAVESKQMAQDGAKFAQETIVEMSRIVDNVNQSSVFMQTLDEQSHKIADIVNVIKDIADQTNLLALNAAIEAARAGEQGRGFAVVADEVRKLAERTKLSTQDIASMIASIQSGTMQAVESMSHGTVIVNEGMRLVGSTGESMTHIHGGTDKVLVAVDDISTSLREQSCASNEIAKSVEGIAQMAEENNSAISGVAVSAEQLRSLSCALKESTARFRL
ncbi:methyl-accepting chemotaxis protein [Propionivibrio sp.]|uniref:methyl-accepting chemotaxis protein n=1 Tax=Propionivibrio sp. TaxID=2212460 RepID=UPI00261A6C26|nr:methyl-accepting chemotaxis protein [Propionivibrio sp.]